MNKCELDTFGQLLMSEVRDESIIRYQNILNGTLKPQYAQRLHKEIIESCDGNLDAVEKLARSVVDNVIFNFLSMLEEHSGNLKLVHVTGLKRTNLNSISDGLAGELFSDDGWITKYSKENGLIE